MANNAPLPLISFDLDELACIPVSSKQCYAIHDGELDPLLSWLDEDNIEIPNPPESTDFESFDALFAFL